MKKNDLLNLIQSDEFIDYHQLKSDDALKQSPELLDELLTEAETKFDQLLEMPDETLSFESFMDPFFENDEDLNNLFKAVDSFNSTDSSELTRSIIADFQPRLVAYYNKVNLNPALYQKLTSIEKQELTEDQKRSIELVIRDMKVAGVHLSEEKREELKTINQELSELSEKFSNNVIDSKAEFFYEIQDENILSEMPAEDMEAAKQEAQKRDSKAPFVFTLSPPSYTAIMRYCTDEKVREIFFKANNQVARSGDKDNRPIALKILELRQKKAELMSFENFAEYILQERMAPNTEKVLETLKTVAEKAGQAAQENIQELKQFAQKETFGEWDLAYYSEKLKKEQFEVDDKTLKPYFSFEKVLEGLFGLVKKLFEIDMRPADVTPYAEGARAYEVFHQGRLIAYYFLDPFARPSKRPGAWANDIRSGYRNSNGTHRLPIVINECNFPSPTPDKPSLLTHRDVETIFHEFGHAIHVMLSSHNLANLNGFHTEWDFVEAPSQILENWCWEYDVLSLFAKHYETGELIPKETVEKLKASKNFMSGLFLTRQNEFGFLDYLLHTEPLPKTIEELDERCYQITDQYSTLKKFEGYSMYTAFSHIFAGGYSAGYYSYVWAEILEADLFEKAKELGVLNPEFGKNYVNKILAPGAKKPPIELFRAFTGREPNINSLFKKHGIEI